MGNAGFEHIKIQNAVDLVQEALVILGIKDTDNENFRSTPNRWVDFILEYLEPFDIEECLSKSFPSSESGFNPMVVQSHIPFEAVCAHHLVPVLGVAHIGYVPNEKVVGLSKLTRLIHGISHSIPSLQETIGDQVVDALCEHLGLDDSTGNRSTVPGAHHIESGALYEQMGPVNAGVTINEVEYTGAMCVIQAEHGCMACRGIKRPGVITSTSSIRGCFLKSEARSEFYNLIASRGSIG